MSHFPFLFSNFKTNNGIREVLSHFFFYFKTEIVWLQSTQTAPALYLMSIAYLQVGTSGVISSRFNGNKKFHSLNNPKVQDKIHFSFCANANYRLDTLDTCVLHGSCNAVLLRLTYMFLFT